MLSTLWQMHKALLIIIPILLLTRFLLNRFPKRYTILLWVILAFRLIFPFSFTSPYSIFQNTSSIGITPTNITNQTTSVLHTTTSDQMETTSDLNDQTESVMPPTKPSYVTFFITLIWLLGIGFLFCLMGIQIYQVRKRIKDATCWYDHIYISDTIQTPFVFGILHPRIYLPTSFQDLDVSKILLHEQMHIHMKDHILRPFGIILACIHWFNPLIWISYHFFIQDIEMACDERVIRSLSKNERAAYSNTLLIVSKMEQTQPHPCLPFGKNNTKKRIMRILSYKKTSIITMSILLILISFVAIVLISNPHTTPDSLNSQHEDNSAAKELYKKRSEYVGDNVAVSSIIYALFTDIDYIQLETSFDNENHGIFIYLNDQIENSTFQSQQMENSKILFGLIKNLDHIIFKNDNNKSFTVTKEFIQTLMPKYDFTAAFENEAVFIKLYQEKLDTTNLQSLMRLPYDISEQELVRKGFTVVIHTQTKNQEQETDFLDAVQNQQPTKFQLAQTTDEGDFILTQITYQDGKFTVVSDTTRDSFGREQYTIQYYRDRELKRFKENDHIDAYLVDKQLSNLSYDEISTQEHSGITYLYSYLNEKDEK